MKIVETCAYDGDYPDEKFLNLPLLTKENATKIAFLINNSFQNHHRYWKVVENDYILSPGFEP